MSNEIIETSAKSKRGGWRGGGRKKGVTGVKHYERRKISLPAAIWKLLTEIAKEYGINRSRYIDKLINAVLHGKINYEKEEKFIKKPKAYTAYMNKSISLLLNNIKKTENNNPMSKDVEEYIIKLKQLRNNHITYYISMRFEIWKKLDEIFKDGKNKISWLFQNIFWTHLRLSQKRRKELESIFIGGIDE